MPQLKFGKYQGYDTRDVPEDYLEWLLRETIRTQKICEEELQRRREVESANDSWIMKLVKAGYRDMMKTYHPDVGGRVEDAQAVQNAYEALRELLTVTTKPVRD